MDFIIDTAGDEALAEKTELFNEKDTLFKIDTTDQSQKLQELCEAKCEELNEKLRQQEEIEERLTKLKIDQQFDDFFDEQGWSREPGVPNLKIKKKHIRFHFDSLDVESGKLKSSLGSVDVDKEMEKSVLKPGFEKEHSLPEYNPSDKKLKALRKKEREKTKGPNWFDIKAPEMTEELKNDLQVLKMRSATDPKHFYKKNDMAKLPKYFQVGHIMDSPLDHVNERLTKKQRKRTLVDELLADAEFNKYNKKKYKEIIDERKKTDYRTHMRTKRQTWKSETKSKRAGKGSS